MPDIYGILSTATRSLLTQQKAIDVTGQNIANVNTPGYSRQRVVMEPSTPINFEPGQMGTGVKAAEIQRIYDGFIGSQINGENATLGQWEATESGLARIELIFNESSGVGLEQAMSAFWSAWQDLANNPSGYPERTALLARSVGRLCQSLEGAPFILAGPGRWGTNNPELGIPVAYGEIAGAAVLVEVAAGRGTPELSYGTHFFGDLVSQETYYMPVFPEMGDRAHEDWLEAQPNAGHEEWVKLITPPEGFKVTFDGQTREAAIYLGSDPTEAV